jgi:ankyrin repeat protein
MDVITQILKRTNFICPKNEKNELPIHLSCELGLYEISLIFLKKMNNLNQQDELGATALNKAINSEHKNRDLIIYLMKSGADLRSENIKGENILLNGLKQSKNDCNLLTILDFEWEYKPQIVVSAVQRGNLLILEKILKKIDKYEWNRSEALEIAIKKSI